MSAKQKINLPKIIRGALVLILCALWLLFAVCYWNRIYPFYRVADFSYLHAAEAFLDPVYFSSVSVYLHLAPFLFLAHLITRIIPDAMQSSLQNRKTARLYTCAATVCIIAGVILMCGSITWIPVWFSVNHPPLNVSGFVKFCNLIYPLLTPVCLLSTICITSVTESRQKKKAPFTLFLIRFGVCTAAGVIVTAASACLLAILNAFLPSAVTMVDHFCHTLASSSSMCLISLVLAPLIEETAFRGLIQHHLSAHMPSWAAIIISSFMFGLWHRNIGQFVYTFLFGLIAGAVFHFTGKIRWSILTHFILNLTAVLAFSTSEQCIFGTIPHLNQIYRIIAGLSVFSAFSVLCALICILIFLIRILAKKS